MLISHWTDGQAICLSDEKFKLLSTSVRRIFESGGGAAGNLRIRKIKRNRSSLRLSPFVCPDLGEDQKKRSAPRFSPFFCPDFLSKFQTGGGA